MGWPKMLCLVRHAESEGNVLTIDERAKTPIATHDYALTPRGREQAQITVRARVQMIEDHIRLRKQDVSKHP